MPPHVSGIQRELDHYENLVELSLQINGLCI